MLFDPLIFLFLYSIAGGRISFNSWGISFSKLEIVLETSVEDLISECTYLHVYRAFVKEENYKDSIAALKKGNIQSLNRYLGINSGELFPTNEVKFCKKCFELDKIMRIKKHLKVFHQIPGVHICEEHAIPLSFVSVNKKVREYLNLWEIVEKSEEYVIPSEVYERVYSFTKLFKEYEQLVKVDHIDLERFKYIVIGKLTEKGYVSFDSLVNQKRLHEEFRSYHTAKFLKYLKSDIDQEYNTSWIRKLTSRKTIGIHHVRGVLMIDFLFDEMAEFFEYKIVNHEPFGEDIWKCKNPVCRHYEEKAVQLISVHRNPNNGGHCGTFFCECGLIYKSTAKHSESSWEYSKVQISEWGHIWRRKLTELAAENMSLTQMAKNLGTSKSVVKRQLVKMGLTNYLERNGVKYNATAEICTVDSE